MLSQPRFYCVVATALVALGLTARAQQGSSKIGVDVVMDLTPAGKLIEVPTPEKPTYYLPIPIGEEDLGPPSATFTRPGLTSAKVENLLAKMLASQHYLLMTKTGHPSLVLTFKWGYKSPDNVTLGRSSEYRGGKPMSERNSNIGGKGSPQFGGAFTEMEGQMTMDPNEVEMKDLVGGHLVNFRSSQDERNPWDHEMNAMTHEARWYVQITAMDYTDWLHHKVTLLWRENISTELWGHYLDEVMPTMINTGAFFVGRELTQPALMTQPLDVPLGWVYVGKAVTVKDPKKTVHRESIWGD